MSLAVVGQYGSEVFLEPVRVVCCGWGMECTEWVEKT